MAIKRSTFAVDVAKWAEKTSRNAQLLVRRIVLDIFSRVVLKTPVGNPTFWKSEKAPPGYVGGRLRGNWQPNVGAAASGELPWRSGAEVDEDVRSTVMGWSGEGPIHLTNNLPYAEAVEDGHSRTQAPAGMVKVTLAEFPGIVTRRIREVKK